MRKKTDRKEGRKGERLRGEEEERKGKRGEKMSLMQKNDIDRGIRQREREIEGGGKERQK